MQLSFMVVWFNCYLNDSTFARNLQWKTTKHIFTIDLSTFNRFVLILISSGLNFNSNIFQLNFVNEFSLASKRKHICFILYFAQFVRIWVEAENRSWFKTELFPEDSSRSEKLVPDYSFLSSWSCSQWAGSNLLDC